MSRPERRRYFLRLPPIATALVTGCFCRFTDDQNTGRNIACANTDQFPSAARYNLKLNRVYIYIVIRDETENTTVLLSYRRGGACFGKIFLFFYNFSRLVGVNCPRSYIVVRKKYGALRITT